MLLKLPSFTKMRFLSLTHEAFLKRRRSLEIPSITMRLPLLLLLRLRQLSTRSLSLTKMCLPLLRLHQVSRQTLMASVNLADLITTSV